MDSNLESWLWFALTWHNYKNASVVMDRISKTSLVSPPTDHTQQGTIKPESWMLLLVSTTHVNNSWCFCSLSPWICAVMFNSEIMLSHLLTHYAIYITHLSLLTVSQPYSYQTSIIHPTVLITHTHQHKTINFKHLIIQTSILRTKQIEPNYTICDGNWCQDKLR